MKELKDTIELMNSDNYEERFKAELLQILIRGNKLSDMIYTYEKGTLNFEPKCSIALLASQEAVMQAYANLLMERAGIEGIDLSDIMVDYVETEEEDK